MSFVKISLKELQEARDLLVWEIHKHLTEKEKLFILSVKKGKPEWNFLGLQGVDVLPAVQWKLLNVGRMDGSKRNAALKKLEKALSQT